ncbi:MAG: DUF2202 domain-containing protein [Parvularculaceae bacterium]
MKKRKSNRSMACAIAACVSTAIGASSAVGAEPAPTTPAVKQALDEALADERKAHASYKAIIDRFGEVRPFSNIVHAEQRHIDALLPLYARYGLTPPADETVVPAEVYTEDLLGLCKIGVAAEIENVRLYDKKLLPAVAAYPDIAEVMRRLRDASNDKHLPAFQRCVDRGGVMGGGGHGRGPGRSRN